MSMLFLLLFGSIGIQEATVFVRFVQPIEVSADCQIERLDSDFVIPPTKYKVISFNHVEHTYDLEELDSNGNPTGVIVTAQPPFPNAWWVGKTVTLPIPPEIS